MSDPNGLLIAKSDKNIYLLPKMANRHGLIAGATGTGKTVTLQVMAESFSAAGVPVFLADVKGDLAGISQSGSATPKIQERLKRLKISSWEYAGAPVTFWDIFGGEGHPARTTISELGPLLLDRLFNLNEIQAGVLSLVFKIADDNGLLILDSKDLRAMLQYAGDHAEQFSTEYGRISAASVGAIQRALLDLDAQGGDKLFGEPALDLDDFLQTDSRGRGMINVLAADKLMLSPKLYATFLLWLLSELYERMPEVGDLDAPKLVFFFDEAHLLFTDAPTPLLEKIEQIIRLVRSKGVGVFFVTQNPLDVPDIVLGQLGNRVQHALRAFTPRDQKAVRAAAETLRSNPKLDVEKAVSELAVGEALVSFLDEKGQPGITERAFIFPPKSQIGPISPVARDAIVRGSVLFGHYEKAIDRESAYEILKSRSGAGAPAGDSGAGQSPRLPQIPLPEPAPAPGRMPAGRHRDSMLEAMGKSAVRAMGSQIGRSIIRGVLGGILGGSRR